MTILDQLPDDAEKAELKHRIAELEARERAHSSALLKAQEETHNKVLILLKEQMKIVQQGSSRMESCLQSNLNHLYKEKDKDRYDKDKDRLANWSTHQQNLALAMAMGNGGAGTPIEQAAPLLQVARVTSENTIHTATILFVAPRRLIGLSIGLSGADSWHPTSFKMFVPGGEFSLSYTTHTIKIKFLTSRRNSSSQLNPTKARPNWNSKLSRIMAAAVKIKTTMALSRLQSRLWHLNIYICTCALYINTSNKYILCTLHLADTKPPQYTRLSSV